MSVFKLLGLISTIALFLPILVMLITQLGWYRSFPSLFAYYFFIVLYNIAILGYVPIPKNWNLYLGIANNLLDAPLMLLFLSYFSWTPSIKKRLQFVLGGFILYELVILFIFGYSRIASTIIAGPGLVVVFLVSLLFFIHQIKITVVYHKAAGKALIVSSLLFAYVGYMYTYVVFYFLNETYRQDAHLVYFLVASASSISLSIGVLMEKKRVRQLSELKITRQELKAIYAGNEKKTTSSLENIVFNFDKKQWN